MPGQPGTLTLTDLESSVEAGRIETVLLAVVDAQGRLKGKHYDAHHFLTHLARPQGGAQAEMCGYVFATDPAMTTDARYALASWDTGFGDVRLQIDLDTLREITWLPGCALVLADASIRSGGPLAVAPRTVLRAQLDRIGALDLVAKAGVETEFTLYHGRLDALASAGYQGLKPVTFDNRDYALDQPGPVARYNRRLKRALGSSGLPVEAVKLEGAPGQVEVTFPYGEAMAACDGHVLFKHATRTLADRMGLAATFMAAPETGTGNGLHLHVSLWQDEHPVLADERRPSGLSELGRHAVAGLLDALPGLALLYAPTVNSYKRYRDRSFAPTRLAWGYDNRSCAVRVVGHGRGLHLEVRLPGADAEPHLALAAVLAAAQTGIARRLKPPPEVTGDAYARTDIPPVPGTLHEALAAFEAGPAAELLGEETARHYADAARNELAVHRGQVTDAERHRHFATA